MRLRYWYLTDEEYSIKSCIYWWHHSTHQWFWPYHWVLLSSSRFAYLYQYQLWSCLHERTASPYMMIFPYLIFKFSLDNPDFSFLSFITQNYKCLKLKPYLT